MYLLGKFTAMKNITSSKKWISACLIAGSLFLAIDGNSQERKLPDGTIIYSDGTRRLPNGTVIYKGGNNGTVGTNYPASTGGQVITLPDGTVVYPDGSRRYPNDDRTNDRRIKGKNKGRNTGAWLPPGQAKKIYGGSAKDYAPGQQKKGKGNGYGKGKSHKG